MWGGGRITEGSQSRLISGRAPAFLNCGVSLYSCPQPLTQSDQLGRGKTYGMDTCVYGVNHANCVLHNASRGYVRLVSVESVKAAITTLITTAYLHRRLQLYNELRLLEIEVRYNAVVVLHQSSCFSAISGPIQYFISINFTVSCRMPDPRSVTAFRFSAYQNHGE